jgi:hypothetical protein
VNTPQQAAEGLEAAATVVVLRDGPVGLEALPVRRTTRLVFAGGHCYETIDASVPGPRHRLVMGDGRWHDERHDALASVEGDG